MASSSLIETKDTDHEEDDGPLLVSKLEVGLFMINDQYNFLI